MEKKEEKIGEALMKVALGYQLAEVTEEYAEVDGEMKLTKRKKTKKDVAPDLKAVQLLLAADGEGDLSKLSDAELEEERQRLLAALQETGVEKKKTVKKSGKTAENGKAAKGASAKTSAKASDVASSAKKRAKPVKRVVRKTKT